MAAFAESVFVKLHKNGRIENMDPGPWTTAWTQFMDHPMDLVHGPPLVFKRKSPWLI